MKALPPDAGAPRRHRFRAMGTDVELIGAGDQSQFEQAGRAVEAVFEEDEHRYSRFQCDSELSLVNERAGESITVSEPFAQLLRFALDGARRSRGLFDPTILPALLNAGYDRDFAEVRTLAERPARGTRLAPPRWWDVRLQGSTVLLPPGMGLDFGGVAKGWTVDRAVASATSLSWALVNAGGDLRLAGDPPRGWVDVAVEDPSDPSLEAARVKLGIGALATSSVAARMWGPGLHHLIDPRTLLPAATEVLQATVWAESCAEAEVRSKWALLTGPPALDRFPGVLVLTGGRVLTNLAAEEAA